jgi:NTE family protein
MSPPSDVAEPSPLGPDAGAVRRAFVLGGGGRWGAVEVGMLRALVEAEIAPDIVLGTSIGAFNGAVFASDPGPGGLAKLEQVWGEAATGQFLDVGMLDRIRTVARLKVALNDSAPLRRILETALDVRTFEELAVSFQCVAASIERAAEHWFSSGPLIEALLASAAIPALFPPVEVDGEHYYDGGLVNSVPLDRAFELGATEVFVLQVGRVEQPLRPPKRFYEPALLAFEISRRHRFSKVRTTDVPGAVVHLLPSANDLDFDDVRQVKWRDMASSDDLIQRAHAASAEYLAGLGMP